MAKRGRIGDYTRAKLDAIIDNKIVTDGPGDITAVTAGGGLDGGGTTGDVTLDIDYAGTDSVIRAAADGTGITVASDDQMLVSDTDDSNNVKYVNVSQIATAVGGGTPGGAATNLQFNRDGSSFGGISTFNVGVYGHLGVSTISASDGAAIYFGDSQDSYIVFDATRGAGVLEISGSSGGGEGVSITGSTVGLYSADKVWLNSSVINIGEDTTDNPRLYFLGSNNDGLISWDEDVDRFLIDDDVVMANDEKMYFGGPAGQHGYIQYNSDTANQYLVISGSSKGVALSGSTIYLDTPALFINHDDTATTAVSPVSIDLDFDKSGVTGDGVTSHYTGQRIDMRDLATNHANATVNMMGMFVNLDSTSAQGTTTNTGIRVDAVDADLNIGLSIITTDANPTKAQDIKIMSSADQGDYFSISTYTAGLTTFTTVDDGGAEADIVFAPDGIVRINDDINLAFGNGEDAYIEYNTTSAKLIMSGAHGGTYFSGSSIHVGPLGAAGTTYGPSTTTPVTAFDTITDLGTTTGDGTACDMISDGQMGGQMIRMGAFDSSVNVVGELISLFRGGWFSADASAAAGASGALDLLIAIAMAVDGDADEGLVLLRGIARIPSTLFTGTAPSLGLVGKPIYASETAGEITLDMPRTSGTIVRVIGYLLDASSSDGLIYFNPDNTWVTIA